MDKEKLREWSAGFADPEAIAGAGGGHDLSVDFNGGFGTGSCGDAMVAGDQRRPGATRLSEQ